MRRLLSVMCVLASVAAGLTANLSSAFAAADTGANSNPSCMGLFSSVDEIRGDAPRSFWAQFAAHSGDNPGHLYHAAVGAPGEHC